MATIKTVSERNKDRLNSFKSKEALEKDGTVFCARSVTAEKGSYGWQWKLHILFREESGRLRTQDIFLGMEKTAEGRNDPEGYNNSIFRDPELDWPEHGCILALAGKKYILSQTVSVAKCPCAGMKEADLELEASASSEEEEAPF